MNAVADASRVRVLSHVPTIVGRAFTQAFALAVAPVAVFLGLRVPAMAAENSIDPYLHTAYIQNGRDVVSRFGTTFYENYYLNYQWVRVGFIIPAHLFSWLLGAVPGFLAFRYLLALVAIVPAYLLFRRMHGTAAGWLAVLVVLTCPVILTAWGSDYPDSAAVSYLLGGTACLAMPAQSAERRLWVIAAGALFALTLHSQVVGALAVGGTVLAYLAVFWRRPVGEALLDIAAMSAAAVVVTGVLVAASYWYYGHGNIFTTTLITIAHYREAQWIAVFHSHTWKWALYDVYLLAPPAVVAGWLAVSWRGRERPRREEAFLALAVTLAVLAHTLAQFVGKNWTLEYYFYTSLLFAGSSLVLTALLVRLSGPLVRHGAWALVPIALVVAVPVLLRPFRSLIQIELPIAAVVAAALVAVAVAARSRPGAAPAGRILALTATIGAATVLITGMEINRPPFPQQVPYLTPDYGTVLFSQGSQLTDEYQVASELHTVVPSLAEESGALATWWAPRHYPVVDFAAAQYLWLEASIGSTMPVLDDSASRALAARAPRWLVLLSDDGREFQPAMQQLQEHGFGPRTWRDRVLTSGSVSLHVRVVELTTHPA